MPDGALGPVTLRSDIRTGRPIARDEYRWDIPVRTPARTSGGRGRREDNAGYRDGSSRGGPQESRDSNPPPRGTLNESRWEEVLTAAAAVFGEKGYRAATLQDIASRLGMLKGSLYYYIDNKEDLLFEIMRRSHLTGLDFITEDPALESAPPAVRLTSLIRAWMSQLASLPSMLQVSEADLRHLRRDRRHEIVSIREQIARVPYGIIAAGVADGSFDPSINPYAATATLFRILNTTNEWYREGGRASWEDVTDWYVRLVLGGLRPGNPEKTMARSSRRRSQA